MWIPTGFNYFDALKQAYDAWADVEGDDDKVETLESCVKSALKTFTDQLKDLEKQFDPGLVERMSRDLKADAFDYIVGFIGKKS